MAFCFSGSLLRANFYIVFFLFYIVIVRGKYISSSFFKVLFTCERPIFSCFASNSRSAGFHVCAKDPQSPWPKQVLYLYRTVDKGGYINWLREMVYRVAQ